jgi:hypothetical protein
MTDPFVPGEPEPEARFTPPTEACPHPEWWHSTDADSTEIEVSELIGALVRALQPEVVIETGSAWGQTTKVIGHALEANGHGTCWSIEPDSERYSHTSSLVEDLPVEMVHAKSLDFRPHDRVNLAFFDSLVDLRIAEFRHFGEHPGYAPGAFVAFHDTADHHGLWPGIAQLEAKGLLLPVRLPTPRGVVIAEVSP